MEKKAMLAKRLADLLKESFANRPFNWNDVAALMKEKLPEYNTSSGSPALSQLRHTGVIRSELDEHGVLVNHYVRDFQPRDIKKIREHSNKNRPGKVDRVERASAAMIAIALGENRTEIVDIVQAKRIYLSLKPLFES